MQKIINKPNLFIATHLGLGDAIICQSIVKLYSKKYNVTIPIYDKYKESIDMMYKNFNIQYHIIQFKSVQSSESYMKIYQIMKQKLSNNQYVLKLGFFNQNYKYFCRIGSLNNTFYEPSNLQPDTQWKVNVLDSRNMNKQIELFNSFNVNQNQYIVLIEDKFRLNAIQNPLVLTKFKNKDIDLPIIRPDTYHTNNIFDYLYLFQNAKYIHTYDTSFTCLIDQCCNLNGICYVHRYARPQQLVLKSVYKNQKMVIID